MKKITSPYKIFIVFCLPIFLTSCLQKKDPFEKQLQFDIPNQWHSKQQPFSTLNKSLSISWLNDFNDPTVNTLVDEALTHNYDLSAAAANLEIARTAVSASRSSLFPSISLSSQRSALSGDIQQRIGDDIINAPLDQVDYSGSLGVSWEVDIWGRQFDAFKASHQDLKSEEQLYNAARLSLTGSVVQAWYGLVSARLQKELAERNVVSNNKIHQLTEKNYRNKLATKLDVVQSRSNLHQSKSELYLRQRTELESTRALELLLGRYPSAELKTTTALMDLPPLDSDHDNAINLGSPVDILSQRPDILSAQANMAAAGLRARNARKALLPSLNITDFFSLSNETSISSLLSLENVLETLSVNLIQPVFQGGALRASIKAEKKRAEQSVANYAQTVLEAFIEVENAIAAEKFLNQQESVQRLAFDDAKQSETFINRLYEEGLTDIFDVLTVNQQRFNSESDLISAQLARIDNRVRLYLSLGVVPPSNTDI